MAASGVNAVISIKKLKINNKINFLTARDSGGPLFVNGVQVGLVSWSMKPCTAPPYPGVYTSTSPYIGWIEKTSGVKLGLNMFVQG